MSIGCELPNPVATASRGATGWTSAAYVNAVAAWEACTSTDRLVLVRRAGVLR